MAGSAAAQEGEAKRIVSSADDGVPLAAQWWLNVHEPARPRCVVVVAHGIHQSGRLYRPEAEGGCSALVDELCAQARANVLCLDLRGWGDSGGDYRAVRDYRTTWMRDVRAVLAYAQGEFPDAPLVYFGHSIGGLIGAALACDADGGGPTGLAAYVLSAPTVVAPPVPGWVRWLLRHLCCCCCLSASCCFPDMKLRESGGCTNNAAFAAAFAEESPEGQRPFPNSIGNALAGIEIIEATKASWQRCFEKVRTNRACAHTSFGGFWVSHADGCVAACARPDRATPAGWLLRRMGRARAEAGAAERCHGPATAGPAGHD